MGQKYKVGDVVQIREDLEVHEGYPMEGYDGAFAVHVNKDMYDLRGKRAKIYGLREFGEYHAGTRDCYAEVGYNIEVDGHVPPWLWTDTMFVDNLLPEIRDAEELKSLYDWA